MFLTFALSVLSGCGKKTPENVLSTDQPPNIYPDYAAVTIPPNIAPMNFVIEEPGDAFVTRIESDKGESIVVTGKSVRIPPEKWRKLLADNTGRSLNIRIYARNDGQWRQFAPVVNRIAAEPIDGWISYRLIEPGYENYHDIVLNERNLESFKERTFYSNDWVDSKTQCVNCHSFRNHRTDRMLFHTRIHKGGTIFVHEGKAKKIDLKTDQVLSGGVYPSWHPDLDLVAFSVNTTFQFFHTLSLAKVEVLDSASDLVLYDVEANEVRHILKTEDDFETFPSWSPDGNWLYYCKAHLVLEGKEELTQPKAPGRIQYSKMRSDATKKHENFHYDLMRLPFDRETKGFGTPETVVDASSRGKSVTFPRISPDGRHLMYTLTEYGTFSIWHDDSDLWLLDLETGESRPLNEVNSDRSESFHNWSSNGRWFVFTSRRDDGSFTRLYLAHFDESGMASKPFLLPQHDPEQNLDLMKSYNVPELTMEPVKVDSRELLRAVNGETQQATYRTD